MSMLLPWSSPPWPCDPGGLDALGGSVGEICVVFKLNSGDDVMHDLLVEVAGKTGGPSVAGLCSAGLSTDLGVPHGIHVI